MFIRTDLNNASPLNTRHRDQRPFPRKAKQSQRIALGEHQSQRCLSGKPGGLALHAAKDSGQNDE